MHVPPRPGVIIRPPTREKERPKKVDSIDSSVGRQLGREVIDHVSASSSNKPSFVVYTNSGTCPFSDELVHFAQKKGILFDTVDVARTRPPSWLPGTPSIVFDDNVYCGDAAFSFVEHFVVHQNKRQQEGEPTRQEKNDFMSGRSKSDTVGCGIQAAFAPPKQIDVDENKFNASTDDIMQKLLAGRK